MKTTQITLAALVLATALTGSAFAQSAGSAGSATDTTSPGATGSVPGATPSQETTPMNQQNGMVYPTPNNAQPNADSTSVGKGH